MAVFSLMVAALASNTSGSAPMPPAATQLASYQGIQQVAQQSCMTPALTGWTLSGTGGAEVTLNPSILVRALASAGVKLNGSIAAARWSGLLQKDAGAAFSNRNDCVSKLFVAMVAALPRVDAANKPLARPSHPEVIYRSLTTQTSTTAETQSNNGNSNGSGLQVNNAGPSTNYMGPTATGGGSVYAIYNNPPVTDVQKQQAREGLTEDLKQLARYPDQELPNPGPSLVQHHFNYTYPRALYLLLSKYYDSTIESIPQGAELVLYKRQYYAFEADAKRGQQKLIIKVSSLASQHEQYVWNWLLEYAVVRSMGYSHETIVAQWSSGFASPDEGEKVFAALKDDPELGPALLRSTQSIGQLTLAAANLLQALQ